MTEQLTHIDEQGDVRMVDVSQKADTERVAVAEGFISMKPETLALIVEGKAAKGDVLACAFAIQLGQSTEAAIALAMPIATLCLAIKNVVNAAMPLLVDRADVFASKGNLKGIYAMHWIIGLVIVVLAFILCSVSFLSLIHI